MSERESKFINWLSGILGSFLIALVIGGLQFMRYSDRSDATQNEKIHQNELKEQATEEKVETMRKEIREDLRDIKIGLDELAKSQARSNALTREYRKNN